MKHIIYFILILVSYQLSVNSQIIIGRVIDENNNPLPYVNIGVLDKNKGTVSKFDGNFQFSVTDLKDSDTLRFSAVGYEKADFLIINFKQLNKRQLMNITLTKKVYQIDEVIVESKKRKPFIIGSKRAGNTTWAWYSLYNGAEIGRLFSYNENLFLRNFYFHIGETNCDSILYRVKIYHVVNQLPDSIINKEEIFFISKLSKGWECINLINNSIKVSNDFIVTLETIEGWNNEDEKSVYLSKIQDKGLSYKRFSSWAPWLKFVGEMSYKIEVSKY